MLDILALILGLSVGYEIWGATNSIQLAGASFLVTSLLGLIYAKLSEIKGRLR